VPPFDFISQSKFAIPTSNNYAVVPSKRCLLIAQMLKAAEFGLTPRGGSRLSDIQIGSFLFVA
jgi:hypothetical protein